MSRVLPPAAEAPQLSGLFGATPPDTEPLWLWYPAANHSRHHHVRGMACLLTCLVSHDMQCPSPHSALLVVVLCHLVTA
jgi:hypothetical protein